MWCEMSWKKSEKTKEGQLFQIVSPFKLAVMQLHFLQTQSLRLDVIDPCFPLKRWEVKSCQVRISLLRLRNFSEHSGDVKACLGASVCLVTIRSN